MAMPTMDCLVKMVLGAVPAITEMSQSPWYLIGATARGQSALQREKTSSQPLGPGDMVLLRSDALVEAWVLSSGSDPLDLLVVVRRPGEGLTDTRGVTPTGGYHPKLPRSLFQGAAPESSRGNGENEEDGEPEGTEGNGEPEGTEGNGEPEVTGGNGEGTGGNVEGSGGGGGSPARPRPRKRFPTGALFAGVLSDLSETE